jgi:hypothetical protein
MELIIRIFGNYCGSRVLSRGSLSGKYEIHNFLGKYYEIKERNGWFWDLTKSY